MLEKKVVKVAISLSKSGYIKEALQVLEVYEAISINAALVALEQYAHTKTSEIKPSMWQKIVSKVPGVCGFNSLSYKKLEAKLASAKKYAKQIEAADKAGKTKKAQWLTTHLMRLVDPEKFNTLGGQIDWHKNKKAYVTWAKAGKAVAQLRKDNESVEGLRSACTGKKSKSKSKSKS